MRRLFLAAAFVLVMFLPAGSDPAPAKADWTILVYMTADTNLEAHGLGDLAEMVHAKHSDQVRVIVQCDRAEDDDEETGHTGMEVGELGNFKGTKRLAIGTDDVVQIADIGEADMGDPKTLADFIAWGVKAYPAQHTALVFWDHGAGWPGYGGDESAHEDMLDLHELDAGLSAGMKSAGLTAFDIIGFDCCLMAALEVMNAVTPYGRTLICSEQLEPGEGWNYDAWLSALVANPAMPPAEIGADICDSFKAFFDEHPEKDVREQGVNITLAAVDSGKVPALVAAVDALATKLLAGLHDGGRQAWLKLAKSLYAAEEYSDTGHHDLADLAAKLKGCGADAECDAVLKAVAAAVTHHIGSRGCPRSHGISIWFPRQLQAEERDGKPVDPLAAYAPCACVRSWAELVQAYHAIAGEDDAAPGVTGLATSDADLAPGEHANLAAQVAAEDVAEAWFVLAEKGENDQKVIIGMIPTDPEKLDDDFDGNWMAIGDKDQKLVAPITSFEEVDDANDVYIVGVPAIYRTPKAGHEIRVTLYFQMDIDEKDKFAGEFIYAIEETEAGPGEIDLEVGGKILPIYQVVNAKGELEEHTVHDGAALTLDEDGLDMVEEDLPAGHYLVGYVVEDYAGNTAEALTEIAVE